MSRKGQVYSDREKRYRPVGSLVGEGASFCIAGVVWEVYWLFTA